MKVAGRVLWIMGSTFLLIDVSYLIWSLNAQNLEVVGLLTIGLSGVLCILMAFYFGRVVRADRGVLAEDRLDAEIDDGDAEVGFYSPWSWWPVLLGLAAATMMVGLAIGPWIALLAVPLFVVCIVGWVFEYYRGYFLR